MATTKKNTKKNTNHTPTWADVSGLCRMYAREVGSGKKSFITFSTTISRKNDDGEYKNLYFDVMFKKDTAPEAEDKEIVTINITKAFLTVKETNDGKLRPAIMVMDWEDVDEDNPLPF